MDFVAKNKGWLIAGGAVLLVIILVMSMFGKVNTLRNQQVAQEAALVAQYQDNQNELSNYVLKFKESLGVADAGTDKLEAILVEAIKGRYDGNMEPGTGGSMFSAITEAYPDLTSTSEAYAKVQSLVESGREAYKNKQSKLLDMVRSYETWQETDIVNSIIIDMLGTPSDRLSVTVGDTTYTGADALKKIKQLVLVQDAITSYETGTTEPLI